VELCGATVKCNSNHRSVDASKPMSRVGTPLNNPHDICNRVLLVGGRKSFCVKAPASVKRKIVEISDDLVFTVNAKKVGLTGSMMVHCLFERFSTR
jgi:hypothetical protein